MLKLAFKEFQIQFIPKEYKKEDFLKKLSEFFIVNMQIVIL